MFVLTSVILGETFTLTLFTLYVSISVLRYVDYCKIFVLVASAKFLVICLYEVLTALLLLQLRIEYCGLLLTILKVSKSTADDFLVFAKSV